MKIAQFIRKHILFISIIGFGIGLRLFFAFSFNHIFDSFNILVLSKSVADTNSVLEGFFVLKNGIQHESQLFGKIYYQVIAAWLHFLNWIKLIDLSYIFDTKSYDPESPYMSGFTHWGPLHYQVTAIKLIQFLYEGVFLFFFLSIARIIKKNSYNTLLIGALFWAINPFLIYPTYVPFQSDLAMTAFLLGGVYFALKSLINKEHRITSKNIILMSVCFAIGAIIKQVPILFIVPFLIVLTPSFLSFLLNAGIFGILYLFISQPFSADTTLMKTFFLASEESTALFNFTLNNASIAVMAYCLTVILIFFHRKSIRSNPFHLIQLSLILLSIVYISEDLSFLYAQFNIWIMPFLMLMAFLDPIFALFLIVPVLGFYRWIIIDNGAMTGSMWLTYGAPLDKVPSFESILMKFLQPKLIHRFINSFFILGHSLIIFYSIKYWNKLNTLPCKFPLMYVPLFLFLIYSTFLAFDFTYRSNFAQITNMKYFDTHDETLTKTPIRFTIWNPNQRRITGIEIALMRKSIQKSDFVVLEVYDESGRKLIHRETNDYTLPNGFGEFRLDFGQGLHNKKLKVQVSKKYGQNTIFIQQADTSSYENNSERDYGQYDSFYDTKPVEIEFPVSQYKINVLGSYTVQDMFANVQKHTKERPSFYYFYISFTLVLLFLSGISMGYFLYQRRAILHENN